MCSAFSREWTLVIIDSFSGHLSLLKDNSFIAKLERMRVKVIIVPKSMTPILQPLDVSLNRPFQQHYRLKYDEWIEQAIDDPNQRTRYGIRTVDYI